MLSLALLPLFANVIVLANALLIAPLLIVLAATVGSADALAPLLIAFHLG